MVQKLICLFLGRWENVVSLYPLGKGDKAQLVVVT